MITPRVAVQLMMIALKEDDEAALLIACQSNPWEYIERKLDWRKTNKEPSYSPVSVWKYQIENAKSLRDGSIDSVRKLIKKRISMLVGHGYRPDRSALTKLAEADGACFSWLMKSLRKENAWPSLLIVDHIRERGSVDFIKKALRAGVDPNEADDIGNTALHLLWGLVESGDLRPGSDAQRYWASRLWGISEVMMMSGARIDMKTLAGVEVEMLIKQCMRFGLECPCESLDEWVSTVESSKLALQTVKVADPAPRPKRRL